MEFIFELFSQMISGVGDDADWTEMGDANGVAEYDAEADELPVAPVNLFELVKFH